MGDSVFSITVTTFPEYARSCSFLSSANSIPQKSIGSYKRHCLQFTYAKMINELNESIALDRLKCDDYGKNDNDDNEPPRDGETSDFMFQFRGVWFYFYSRLPERIA